MRSRKYLTRVTPELCIVVLRRQATIDMPEERFWWNVIAQALRDCHGKGERNCRAFFASQRFIRICALVGIDGRWAREILAKLNQPIPDSK